MSEPLYRWTIKVREKNTYGDRVTSLTPTTVLAKNRAEVTDKVREAFGAKYDDFRRFWSHDWILDSVDEVAA